MVSLRIFEAICSSSCVWLDLARISNLHRSLRETQVKELVEQVAKMGRGIEAGQDARNIWRCCKLCPGTTLFGFSGALATIFGGYAAVSPTITFSGCGAFFSLKMPSSSYHVPASLPSSCPPPLQSPAPAPLEPSASAAGFHFPRHHATRHA